MKMMLSDTLLVTSYEKTYDKEVKKLGKLSFGVIKNEEAEIDKFCNNDSCEIIPTTGDNDDQDFAK